MLMVDLKEYISKKLDFCLNNVYTISESKGSHLCQLKLKNGAILLVLESLKQ